MASMIQNFLGSSLSFGKKLTLMRTVTHYSHDRAFVLRQHKSLVSNNVSMCLMSNPIVNFPQLPSQTVAKRHPQVVVAANGKDQWDYGGDQESEELPEMKLEYFILNFVHAINVNNREDIEDKLSPSCEVIDPFFQVAPGKEGVANFILDLRDALGPNVNFKLEEIVPRKTENSWDVIVRWHLGKELEPGKGLHGSNVFKCEELSDNKFLIRKIFGSIPPHEAPKFREKLADAGIELLSQLFLANDVMELMKAIMRYYQKLP